MGNFISNPVHQNVALTPTISSNIVVIAANIQTNTTINDFSVYIDSISGNEGTGSFAGGNFSISFYNNLKEGDLLHIQSRNSHTDDPSIYRIDSLENLGTFSSGVTGFRGFKYTVLDGTNLTSKLANITIERHYNNSGVFINKNLNQRVTYAPIIGGLFSHTVASIFTIGSALGPFILDRYSFSQQPNSSNYYADTFFDDLTISSAIPRLEAFHFNLFESHITAYNTTGSSPNDFIPQNAAGKWSEGTPYELFTEEEDFAYERRIKLGAHTHTFSGDQTTLTYQDSLTSVPNVHGVAGVTGGTLDQLDIINISFLNNTTNKTFKLGNNATGVLDTGGSGFDLIGGVITGTFELR